MRSMTTTQVNLAFMRSLGEDWKVFNQALGETLYSLLCRIDSPLTSFCINCKKRGHTIDECWIKLKQYTESQYQNDNGNNDDEYGSGFGQRQISSQKRNGNRSNGSSSNSTFDKVKYRWKLNWQVWII